MTVLDAMNAGKKRHKPSYEVIDYGAKFEAGCHVASLDLPPALNHWYCRDCGLGVPSDRVTCPHCTQTDGSLIIGGQS